MKRRNHSVLVKGRFLAVGIIPGWAATQLLPTNATDQEPVDLHLGCPHCAVGLVVNEPNHC